MWVGAVEGVCGVHVDACVHVYACVYVHLCAQYVAHVCILFTCDFSDSGVLADLIIALLFFFLTHPT